MMELWPKRSQKISPGCIVITPMRGAAVAEKAMNIRHKNAASGPKPARSRLRIAQHPNVEGMHASRIGIGHAEHEATHGQFFAGFR